MSVQDGLEARAAFEVIDACDRVLPRLLEVIAQHEHAATVARAEWRGPHHKAFEARFSSVQHALGLGCARVLQARHDAMLRLERPAA